MVVQDFLSAVAGKVAQAFMPNNTNISSKSVFSSTSAPKNNATKSTAQKVASNFSASQPQQTLNQLTGMVNTPFQYNPKTDAAAQSAIKAAERQMKKNQDSSFVDMTRRGIGNSSVSETIQNQIAGQTAENIATNIIPFYQQQAYQQHQNQISNLGNLYSLQNQEYFQNPLQQAQLEIQQAHLPIQEAQLTGFYQPPAIMEAARRVLGYKDEWDNPETTPERKRELEQLANQDRALIDSMGGNSSMIGANVTYDQSLKDYARIGIPTLAAQAQQFNQGLQTRQQDLTETQVFAALTGVMPDGTPTTTEQQRQLENEWTVARETGRITPVLAQMYGIPEGTPTFAAEQAAIDNAIQRAQVAISQQNANTSAGRLAMDQNQEGRMQDARQYESTLLNELNILRQNGATEQDIQDYLSLNAGDIAANLGREGYEDILQTATTFAPDTSSEEEAQRMRSDAIKMAQTDIRWSTADAKTKETIIQEYINLLGG